MNDEPNNTQDKIVTPRTDAECWREDQHSEWCDASFARTLERELTASTSALDEAREALEEIVKVWSKQRGRVFESMGETNPRAMQLDDTIKVARTILSKNTTTPKPQS